MKKRLPKISAAADDPADYRSLYFNVNPEVYAPAGSRGRLRVALRDIRIRLWSRLLVRKGRKARLFRGARRRGSRSWTARCGKD